VAEHLLAEALGGALPVGEFLGAEQTTRGSLPE
jgi:hypothetical protein